MYRIILKQHNQVVGSSPIALNEDWHKKADEFSFKLLSQGKIEVGYYDCYLIRDSDNTEIDYDIFVA